ncbi:sugar-binding transcriptional regulator [Bifidobacterium actinocoloniiforme]|uniref:sugar-binding transcriptional regulator n=1 Tax=Bifidobacterium actinocoloniiforme TaxID=638619 RepID=UPI00130E2908|nr:sugar-binding domain-containing protein [Bifidobacterium actinocoloniiforme]
MSRPTVSRLLRFSRDQGLVRLEIADPAKDREAAASRLEAKYGLKKALLVYDASHDRRILNEKLGERAAGYLASIVRDHDRIGISWGRALEEVANHLRPSSCKDVSVVQLKGSVSVSDMNNYANDISRNFGAAFQTNTLALPLPVIFDSAVTKDIVMRDRFIADVFAAGKATNIAIFTCGTVRNDAMLFKLGYLDKSETARLQAHAVGDVISHFITADGSLADADIDAKTVSLPLGEVKEKEYSILVVGAAPKISAIRGTLLGGYANVLITDYESALSFLA